MHILYCKLRNIIIDKLLDIATQLKFTCSSSTTLSEIGWDLVESRWPSEVGTLVEISFGLPLSATWWNLNYQRAVY